MPSDLRGGRPDVQLFGAPDALAALGAYGAGVDSVELKALVEPPAGPAAEALTQRRSPTWSVRQSYLLDTSALDLVRAGVEVRLRRRARGRYDLAVSARRGLTGCDRSAPSGARVELDVVPGGLWHDIEVRREVDPSQAAAVIAGTTKAGAALSAPQCLWACHGGDDVVDAARLIELRVHGPLVVRRVKVASTHPDLRRADLEHFRFPSGRELLELSTHCDPQGVPAVAAAFEELLDARGVTVVPSYRTRTSVWREEVTGGG